MVKCFQLEKKINGHPDTNISFLHLFLLVDWRGSLFFGRPPHHPGSLAARFSITRTAGQQFLLMDILGLSLSISVRSQKRKLSPEAGGHFWKNQCPPTPFFWGGGGLDSLFLNFWFLVTQSLNTTIQRLGL